MGDWDQDPGAQRWIKHIRTELVPKIDGSAATISVVPSGETDIKFAVELGLSIMLDKPIIAVVQAGTKVPERLARVADEIVEADWSNNQLTADRINAAVARVFREIGPTDDG